MQNKQSHSLLFFLGSVGLIMVAIGFTAIINRTQKTGTESSDLRAKAGVTQTLQFVGVVNLTDSSDLLVVDNMRFANNPNQNLGTWHVTPPRTTGARGFSPGTKITITADSTTVNIQAHTMTATFIK